MEMVEVKTSELIGVALDWAVGRVEALPIEFCDSDFDEERNYCFLNRSVFDSRGVRTFCSGSIWFPSTNWSQGGPLIERYCGLTNDHVDDPTEPFYAETRCSNMEGYANGATLLIAVCRAIVAAKLGDEVDVPEGLV